MEPRYMNAVSADFTRARGKARRTKVMSFVSRRSDDLPTFRQIQRIVHPNGQGYAGCKTIPVGSIVGSEDRSADFNRDFMPRKAFLQNRWCNVDTAFYQGKILPPIQVLELGGVYFIRDGNHRVSVARAHGVAYIDAEVTEMRSEMKIDPSALVS